MIGPILDMTLRFFVNVIFLLIIARVLYYPHSKRREYLFTFMILGITVFFLCYLLSSINLELGLALGLFAIFGILRYRTTTVEIREMTYMFLAITISVINSLTAAGYPVLLIVGVNILIVGIAWVLEALWYGRSDKRITVVYERIELIRPERRGELIEDLSARLGIQVSEVEIGSVNFLRDTAEVTVHFSRAEEHFSSSL